jgi:hypothetical protein
MNVLTIRLNYLNWRLGIRGDKNEETSCDLANNSTLRTKGLLRKRWIDEVVLRELSQEDGKNRGCARYNDTHGYSIIGGCR